MDNIVVITQNVKLESLSKLRTYIERGSETLVFSTQFVFENEVPVIEQALDSKCTFLSFGDFLTDRDYEACDIMAYDENYPNSTVYFDEIKRLKNRLLVTRLLDKYPCNTRLMVCNDLGLEEDDWLPFGFKKVECEYYYTKPFIGRRRYQVYTRKFKSLIKLIKNIYRTPIFRANIKGQEYRFYGSMNRIAYRMEPMFEVCPKSENWKYIRNFFLNLVFHYVPENNIINLSTLHEAGAWRLPDNPRFKLRLIQDGYLPPNYSSKYLRYYEKNAEFYTWDIEGGRTFEMHHLPHRILPFRKKLYLPEPIYPKKVEKVLCVASGAGDWTAVKCRSDEDRMLRVFGKIAKQFPEIDFVYRCHPVWINPDFQGVNSINRAAEYISWLNLPNLKISSNIPNANENGKFRFSYKRSSFEEDLNGVDIVFGEHSISQIDAAFKKILFCSVNVTGRRDLFAGISEMGFPHCESEEEICKFLRELTTETFRTGYDMAIKNYNNMTDHE